MRPIFLLSLPRSGSTLLLELLGAHPEISVAGELARDAWEARAAAIGIDSSWEARSPSNSGLEPWFLLPMLYSLKTSGAAAEYNHRVAASAIDAFSRHLPDGADSYRAEIAEFAKRIYRTVSEPDAVYFVDKTPRYHLIAEELLDMFPDARFVILWRNPLAVAASILNTWGGGRWNLFRHRIDLFQGLANLVEVARIGDHDRVMTIRYEDLVMNPRDAVRAVYGWLGLDEQAAHSLEATGQSLAFGNKRDESLHAVSTARLRSWRESFASHPRRWWAKRYLAWLGRERVATMGYSLTELCDELASAPPTLRGCGDDAWRMVYGWVRERIRRLQYR